jgi:phosphatidylglycerophosphate synthase
VTCVDPSTTSGAGLAGRRPADLVTTFRGVLVAVLGVLVGTALLSGEPTRSWEVVWVAVPAWALDALDGYVARRTGTASDRGALLDSAVDGTLVLVLSVALAGTAPWALVGGLLWPAFLAVQVWRPAWRRTLPHSIARKVAGGTLTGTLAIGAAPFWPGSAVQAAVALAVLGVTWSFAVDVRWLERAAPPGP